jgi:HTH-type transcriptional regulator / antitoxin HigA
LKLNFTTIPRSVKHFIQFANLRKLAYNKNVNSNISFETPGEYLDSLLSQRGWTQRVLATVMSIEETAISKLIKNKRPITAELALALESTFSIPAERFLGIQKDFELAQARRASKPNPAAIQRAQLIGALPIPEMIKRCWLDVRDVRDGAKLEAELIRFFGADSVADIEVLPHAAKKTNVSDDTTPQQLAWLYRVKQLASEMLVAPYSPFGVRRAVELLRGLILSAEEARKVPRILAEAGIRFVIVESLPQAKIDGVCFWLDDASPVIGLSMRHDRIDNFWFVLRHELEHVIQGHGKSGGQIVVDSNLEGERAGVGSDVSEDERIANAAAAEFCVPKKTMDSFIARKAPFFAERDILGVAATLHIHPGLVAGQLQHRTGRYDRFRSHLVKMRSIVAPNAIVDGWGDVAPIGI